jgi:putative nucleotidyltransferase with HDIG domain
MSNLPTEEVAAERIAELIKSDAVLTARILRAANSPYYSLRWEANDLSRVLTLLGFEEVSRLVLVYQMKQRVFALSADQRRFLELFWKHSIATATVARMIAQFVDFQANGRELAAGLLHDVGKLVLVQSFPEQHETIQRMIREPGMTDIVAETQTLGFTHAEAGDALGKKWGIPPLFVEAMRYHHEPGAATINPPLVALTRFSDLLCERWNSGVGEQLLNIHLEDDESWQIMRETFPRLSDERADAIEQKLLALYEMNREFVALFA